MTVSRPIRARISRSALLANYRLARRLAPAARAWAVIKADAYGHGQWRAVETLRGEADGFAVLECENAVALRAAGVTQPILLLEGIFSAERRAGRRRAPAGYHRALPGTARHAARCRARRRRRWRSTSSSTPA